VLAGSCLYLLNGIRGTWCSWIFLWYVRYRYMVWINPMILVKVRVIMPFSSIISRLDIMLRCCLVYYYVTMHASYYISSLYQSQFVGSRANHAYFMTSSLFMHVAYDYISLLF
jgi:hypothetical protein